MCAIERGADQRVHTGRNADVAHFALALELRYRREQHAGLRNEIPAGLYPEGNVRMRRLERRQNRAELRQHDTRLAKPLGDAEPTAQIDRTYVFETRRQVRKRVADLLPVVDGEHAATRVGMQSHDSLAGCLDELFELLHFE